MKLTLKALVLVVSALSVIPAFASDLDGRTYCRMVQFGGMLGQPAGTRAHCVSFANGIMTDNANAFFGNPPQSEKYIFANGNIMVARREAWIIEYIARRDLRAIRNQAGAVLTLR